MRRSIVLFALLTSGCMMFQTPPSLDTRDFLDGHNNLLLAPYRYTIGETDQTIRIPAGFVTDYASIPSAFWGILGPHGRYQRATVVHDYLYWSQSCTREQADNLLLIAMKELGVGWVDRSMIYRGVRAGGASPWASNARERAAQQPKIVPVNRFDMAHSMTWKDARKALVAAGMRDPKFPASEPYCAYGDSTRVPEAAKALSEG